MAAAQDMLAASDAHLAGLVGQQVHEAVHARVLALQQNVLLPLPVSGELRVTQAGSVGA